MKTIYEKPMALVNEDFAEGVYMASGSCYSTTWTMTQPPQTGRGTYVVHLDGKHNSTKTDNHTSDAQTITVNFNQVVTYSSSSAKSCSGSGTSSLVLSFTYHQNSSDNIGLGDLSVVSEPGLSVVSVSISDGH